MTVPEEVFDFERHLRARICLRKTSKRHERKLSSKPMMKSLEFGQQFF